MSWIFINIEGVYLWSFFFNFPRKLEYFENIIFPEIVPVFKTK